jgi:hypothetical protein
LRLLHQCFREQRNMFTFITDQQQVSFALWTLYHEGLDGVKAEFW